MFVNMLQETRGLRITRLRILAQKPCTSATRWRSPRPALFSFGRVVLSLQGCGPSVNSGTAAFKSLQFDLGQKLSTIVTSFVPPSKKIILELEEGMVVNGRAMVFGFTAPCQPPFNCTRTHADLRRNLPRGSDPGIAQAHHLFIQITTLPLSLLPQALQRCLFLRGVLDVLMTCSDFIHRGDAGKTDSFAMTTDCQTKSLA